MEGGRQKGNRATNKLAAKANKGKANKPRKAPEAKQWLQQMERKKQQRLSSPPANNQPCTQPGHRKDQQGAVRLSTNRNSKPPSSSKVTTSKRRTNHQPTHQKQGSLLAPDEDARSQPSIPQIASSSVHPAAEEATQQTPIAVEATKKHSIKAPGARKRRWRGQNPNYAEAFYFLNYLQHF